MVELAGAYPLLERLDMPGPGRLATQHGVVRRNAQGGVHIVLTPQGRKLFCAALQIAEPWTTWPADFVAGAKSYADMAPPPPSSWEFHIANLLWRYPHLAFRRSDLEEAAKAMDTAFTSNPGPAKFPAYDEDGDVIQKANKTGQWGLLRWQGDGSGRYNLARPTDGAPTHYYFLDPLVRRDPTVRKTRTQQMVTHLAATPAMTAAESFRYEALSYIYREWFHQLEKDWTLNGHRDPDNKSTGGVLAQPKKFNKDTQNRWKLDEFGFPELPTVGHLLANAMAWFPANDARRLLRDAALAALETATAGAPAPVVALPVGTATMRQRMHQVLEHALLHWVAAPLGEWPTAPSFDPMRPVGQARRLRGRWVPHPSAVYCPDAPVLAELLPRRYGRHELQRLVDGLPVD